MLDLGRLIPNNRIHKTYFIGIGGAGMSGIAELLHHNGFDVSGSDMQSSQQTEYLQNLGVKIFVGHKAENVADVELVVYSSAVGEDNPEMQYARKHGIPVIRRAEMLGELMRLKYTLAIAGTHGKSSTTSLLGSILETAGEDPTVIVGGIVQGKGSGTTIGKGPYLAAEADEYDRSFLQMQPSSALITNIDADHLDTYAGLDEIKNAFVQFANKVPFYGQVVLCIDDIGCQSILARLVKPVITYGFSPQATYSIKNCRYSEHGAKFEVLCRGKSLGEFSIRLLGRHNVQNAVGALAIATEESISIELSKKALANFAGVKRRMEFKGKAKKALVFDDYAHHPTEVAATLSALRDSFPEKRIIAIFQPHLYSRTKDQAEEFGTVFGNSDILLVCDIYGSREQPIEGVTGKLVFDFAHSRGHKNAHFIGAKEKALDFLKEEIKDGDLIVTMGAGNITVLSSQILEIA
ncbi:MAG: UDP-N-acetylmuramate--L-alanine ligase [Fibromonadaceae bacterium]|jgi:UDP-N-acetylmuramate--alanine ligase|nr:UDP-N-acetylmuramate--L-alanine ligase [Fibromonadaceae bacterium]